MLLRASERALLEAGVSRDGQERVLVACSGGPDSMALLRVALVLLGPDRVAVGHVDHGTRRGSAADAAWLAELARRERVAFFTERLEPDRTDEARLRALRYAALERMRRAADAALILVGHTQDDQAETVLLRLLRVGGVDALGGMPARNGHVLRPLLGVSRTRIRRYLDRKRWPYRVDPSNLEPEHLRNRVRKELLPLLERRYRPGFTARLADLAAAVRIRGIPRDAAAGGGEGPRPRRTTPPASVERTDPRAQRFRGWREGGLELQHRVWRPEQDPSEGAPLRVRFDAERLEALRIRGARPGDRVRPFGRSGGRRKISDVLGEAGVPVELRPGWPLLVHGTGEQERVLWVAGLLRSDAAPVHAETRVVWEASVAEVSG